MGKIKVFGCIVLVTAFVMVFTLASVLEIVEIASAYTATSEDLEYVESVYEGPYGVLIEEENYPKQIKDSELLECTNTYEDANPCYGEHRGEKLKFKVKLKNTGNETATFNIALWDANRGRYLSRVQMYDDFGIVQTPTLKPGEESVELTLRGRLETPIEMPDSEHYKLKIEVQHKEGTWPFEEWVTDSEHPFIVCYKDDVMPKETPTPTPTVPGFGIVSVIGSLLAVSYLVLRRRG
ncbi:hypothetical protein C4E24_06305 [ANME-1 cluster archaeon AG-394-G21]|nr:hypothetical protein [ANME-1 cluster archaeon AG-394-G21]